jgi:AbiV family abortive infection protein
MKPIKIFKVRGRAPLKNGPLSQVEALSAQHAAAAAARGLYGDAVFLYQHGRRQRAAALAILALEEVGKIKVLARIADATDESALKAAWREYRMHNAKASEMISAGPGLDEADVRRAFSEQADGLKQLAFYSTQLASGEWVWPEIAIDDDDSELAVSWAGAMVGQLPAQGLDRPK